MFRILQLNLFSKQGKPFTYKFSKGINYFKGENSTGKTEFYLFLDYMLGASLDISKKPWYKDSLLKATMTLEYNDISFSLTRTTNPDENYFSYDVDDVKNQIDLRTYKAKINSIFCQDENFQKKIKNFTNEKLTYRPFTMFNFLGENGQGKIQDFLDKCSDISYSVRLNSILNYIFNNNVDRIIDLQQQLKQLILDQNEMELKTHYDNYIINKINSNLLKLNSNIIYTGKNVGEIKSFLTSVKEMEQPYMINNKKTIASLVVTYNNILEQIKVNEKSIYDTKEFIKDDNSRRKLVTKLQELVNDNTEFEYLISPIQNLINEIDNNIFFSNYITKDNTVKELKNKLKKIKLEIKRNNSKFKCYTVNQKEKSIALIEDYLTEVIGNNDIKLIQQRIKNIKKEIQILQNSDDESKINDMSKVVTDLYLSAKNVSTIVSEDIENSGFEIQYLKKGNILQPRILTKNIDTYTTNTKVNLYVGSMARHTLIQLCGYLSFMNLMINCGNYPLVPILVIDHISKPFDESNSKAIGFVINAAYELIGKENLQTFIFDNVDNEDLNITADHVVNLVSEGKTGFNPFFIPINK